MEPSLLSGPLGSTQWESEQTFPLGFLTLDSDKGGILCPNQSGPTGLEFTDGDGDQTLQQGGGDKPMELDELIYVTDFSCGGLPFEDDRSSRPKASRRSTLIDELSCTEKNKGLDEISDLTLSWLFSPNLTEVVGKNFAFEERQEDQDELIILNEPTSPPKISRRNSEMDPGDPVFFFQSDERSCVPCESSGVSDPQGVGEELAGLPPAQGTLSPETGDKGFFPDQVTDLPVTSSSSPQSRRESSLLWDTPADSDSSLNQLTSRPAVICTGARLDSSTDEEDVERRETRNQASEQQGQNDSFVLGVSAVVPSLTETGDEFIIDSCSVEKENVMENKVRSEAEHQREEPMALDLGSTAEEETWDLEQLEGVGDEKALDGTTEGGGEERSRDVSQLQRPDCPEGASSLREVNSSSEAGWTSEQSVETGSLSKMVVDDSLPMVSAGTTGEEAVSPLKAVFDALDQDGDGFVRIEEFMEFAAAYGADQVKDLTKFLDPSGLGVISFEDFHRGISAISSGGPEPQLYGVNYSPGDGAVGCQEEYDEQNEVTDSAYLGSESTYSECETFTDEDTGALVPPEMHEDVDTDSGIEATLHDAEDGVNRSEFSLNPDLHERSLVTVIGGDEEHFEDFGESNMSELLLESSMEGTDGVGDSPVPPLPEQVNGSSLLSPSAPAPLPDCFQSFLREEALDFFCSQCHKQISRLEDLSTRLNFLELTSAGKRLSSKKVARHLLQNSSMTLDTVSDLTRDILDLADNDITDKVLLLERRVAELEKESEASGEQHARLRQENLQLVHRANALEEQLKEQELHTDEQQQQESRRHKEALNKLERERGLEIENLQARVQQLDEENGELRSCVPCLRANIERLEEEKTKLLDETETMSSRLKEETESRQKMADRLSHERHQSQKEKESTQELIEDLRKQLEHLQLYKLEAEAKRGRLPSAGLQEYQTRTREAELEQEIKRLKQDNRTLKEQNDELNGQIINLSIQGAKNLMSASFSDSLAAEINSVSRSELMEAVHKQEEINYRLQDYIDKIIVAIMECNPSILEVK